MHGMVTTFAPLFLSHGSPMTALEPREAGAFMQQLGQVLLRTQGRPKAVLAISAHSLTREPVLLAAPRHEAVYDFGGFDVLRAQWGQVGNVPVMSVVENPFHGIEGFAFVEDDDVETVSLGIEVNLDLVPGHSSVRVLDDVRRRFVYGERDLLRLDRVEPRRFGQRRREPMDHVEVAILARKAKLHQRALPLGLALSGLRRHRAQPPEIG